MVPMAVVLIYFLLYYTASLDVGGTSKPYARFRKLTAAGKANGIVGARRAARAKLGERSHAFFHPLVTDC